MKLTRHGRRLLYQNQVFNIFLDEVEDENHHVVKDYLVIDPKHKIADEYEKNPNGAAVMPILDGKIGLMEMYRHPISAYSWEIPRGFRDAGESDLYRTALRELEEETGLLCARDSIRSLGIISPEPGVINGRIELFVAEKCTRKDDFKPNEYGMVQLRFFDPSEVEKMLADSLIQDPSTVAAYLKYKFKIHRDTP